MVALNQDEYCTLYQLQRNLPTRRHETETGPLPLQDHQLQPTIPIVSASFANRLRPQTSRLKLLVALSAVPPSPSLAAPLPPFLTFRSSQLH